MASSHLTRRRFLAGAAAAAGFAGVSRFAGRSFVRPAHAADELEPSLVILYLRGGYNAMFTSADSFVGNGAFGVTSDNIRRIAQSDLYVDRNSLGALTVEARQRMAAVGVRHGLSAHPAAQQALWMDGNKSYPIQLAAALGGDAAVRCAAIGQLPPGNHRAIGDVSMQQIRDLGTVIAALGGTTAADAPERAMAAGGIAASQAMSATAVARNPVSSASLDEGYAAAVGLLTQDVVPLDYAEMAAAYGITPGAGGALPTAVRANVRMQLLGAELMIRAGARVVTTVSPGWDSHGDRNGSEVRTKMQQSGINEALRVFLARTLAMPGRNVVTAIFGDFSRSLPGSDHQANLTATVIGNPVKVGTTGRVSASVGLPSGTPGIRGMWAYFGAALGAADAPFGNNPHGSLLL